MARAEIGSRSGRVEIVVTLSRRNLLTLLHKLEMPGSKRMIVNNDCCVEGDWAPTHTLVLRCEGDAEHYARRPSPPGPMHPQTERFIGEGRGWSALRG